MTCPKTLFSESETAITYLVYIFNVCNELKKNFRKTLSIETGSNMQDAFVDSRL